VGWRGRGGSVLSAPGAKGETRIEEPSPAERAVVRRVAEARATVPDLELRADIDMEQGLRLRARERCSTTAMLMRACALALREVPRANGAYRDGRFELYSRVNVGVAVPVSGAYVIPTVFDADAKALTSLTAELEELAEGARGGALPAPAFSGATFTLYDLGSDEVMSAGAITNPPQAAALAAGAIREAPLVREGAVVAGHVMTVTLACDHRILYGQEAARFLAAVKEKLEWGSL